MQPKIAINYLERAREALDEQMESADPEQIKESGAMAATFITLSVAQSLERIADALEAMLPQPGDDVQSYSWVRFPHEH